MMERTHAYTALCLWEDHLHHIEDRIHPITAFRNLHSANEARELCLNIAPFVDMVWAATGDTYKATNSFAWAFIPSLMTYYRGWPLPTDDMTEEAAEMAAQVILAASKRTSKSTRK